jgi:undecaprenyl-diphosphatase
LPAELARIGFGGAALACAAAAAALGALVARRPPGLLDVLAVRLRGRGVRIAFAFTLAGRARPLIALGTLAFGIATLVRADVAAVTLVLATQLASQLVNAVAKRIYRRPRPAALHGLPEREFSYPSGHAVTAVVFFAGFALLARSLPAGPLREVVVAGLSACAVLVPWSRLALGAHYLSDIAGGMLCGAAWLLLLAAFFGLA